MRRQSLVQRSWWRWNTWCDTQAVSYTHLNDTILAKVDQIGAACHTGSRSCFFKPLVQKEYNDTNPCLLYTSLLIFFSAMLYFHTRLTIWTVIAVVGCLPACKSLVSLITVSYTHLDVYKRQMWSTVTLQDLSNYNLILQTYKNRWSETIICFFLQINRFVSFSVHFFNFMLL